jgi:hypothetical protein
MVEPKYIGIACAVIIILLIIYLYRRAPAKKSAKKEKLKGKRREKTSNRAAASGNESVRKQDESEDSGDEEESDDEDSGSSQGSDAAGRLYKRVHARMASGMTLEEFKQAAGDDADGFVYPLLAQKYNQAKQAGKDPVRGVTLRDYQEVMNGELDE